MIRYFWKSADAMLAEAAADGCKWTQLNTWIYWQIYDKFFEKQDKMLFAAAAAKSAREAIKEQKEIMLELREIITQEIWAIDPEYCEKSSDAPWNEPWRWKHTLVEKIADIIKEYRIIELEEEL